MILPLASSDCQSPGSASASESARWGEWSMWEWWAKMWAESPFGPIDVS